jgi:hypothetical protein
MPLPRSAEEKGKKYLTEGRLQVERVDPARGIIVAVCRGSDQSYFLGYDPKKNEWRCTCEASSNFGRRCSHLHALQLVVQRPRPVR